MKKSEVPQEGGVYDPHKLTQYAVDSDGRYVMTLSSGWDVTNTSNALTWLEIRKQVAAVREKFLAGEVSPLAYLMAANQMDVPLLAAYVGLARWRVRRHLKPAVFKRLKRPILEKYAEVFRLPVERLDTPPAPEQILFSEGHLD